MAGLILCIIGILFAAAGLILEKKQQRGSPDHSRFDPKTLVKTGGWILLAGVVLLVFSLSGF